MATKRPAAAASAQPSKAAKHEAASSPASSAAPSQGAAQPNGGPASAPPMLSWGKYEERYLVPDGRALRDCGAAGDCFYLCLAAHVFGLDVMSVSQQPLQASLVAFLRHIIADALEHDGIMTIASIVSAHEEYRPTVAQLKAEKLKEHQGELQPAASWKDYVALVRTTAAYATRLEVILASILFRADIQVTSLYRHAVTDRIASPHDAEATQKLMQQLPTMARLLKTAQWTDAHTLKSPPSPLLLVNAMQHYKLVVCGEAGKFNSLPLRSGPGSKDEPLSPCVVQPLEPLLTAIVALMASISVGTSAPAASARSSTGSSDLALLQHQAIRTLDPKDVRVYYEAYYASHDRSSLPPITVDSEQQLDWLLRLASGASAAPVCSVSNGASRDLVTLDRFNDFCGGLGDLQIKIQQEVFPKEEHAKATKAITASAKWTLDKVRKRLSDHGVPWSKHDSDAQLRAQLSELIRASDAKNDWRRHKLDDSMKRLAAVGAEVAGTNELSIGLVGRMGMGKTLMIMSIVLAEKDQATGAFQNPLLNHAVFPFESKPGHRSVTQLPVRYEYADHFEILAQHFQEADLDELTVPLPQADGMRAGCDGLCVSLVEEALPAGGQAYTEPIADVLRRLTVNYQRHSQHAASVKHLIFRGPFAFLRGLCSLWDFPGMADPDPLVNLRSRICVLGLDVLMLVTEDRAQGDMVSFLGFFGHCLNQPSAQLPQLLFVDNLAKSRTSEEKRLMQDPAFTEAQHRQECLVLFIEALLNPAVYNSNADLNVHICKRFSEHVNSSEALIFLTHDDEVRQAAAPYPLLTHLQAKIARLLSVKQHRMLQAGLVQAREFLQEAETIAWTTSSIVYRTRPMHAPGAKKLLAAVDRAVENQVQEEVTQLSAEALWLSTLVSVEELLCSNLLLQSQAPFDIAAAAPAPALVVEQLSDPSSPCHVQLVGALCRTGTIVVDALVDQQLRMQLLRSALRSRYILFHEIPAVLMRQLKSITFVSQPATGRRSGGESFEIESMSAASIRAIYDALEEEWGAVVAAALASLHQELDVAAVSAATPSASSEQQQVEQRQQILDAFFAQYVVDATKQAQKQLTKRVNGNDSVWRCQTISRAILNAVADSQGQAGFDIRMVLRRAVGALVQESPVQKALASQCIVDATGKKYAMNRFAKSSDLRDLAPKVLLETSQLLRAKARELQQHLSSELLFTADTHAVDHVDAKLASFLLPPTRYVASIKHLEDAEKALRESLKLQHGETHPRIDALRASMRASLLRAEKLPPPNPEPSPNCTAVVVGQMSEVEFQQALADGQLVDPVLNPTQVGVRIIWSAADIDAGVGVDTARSKRIRIEFATAASDDADAALPQVLNIFLYEGVVDDLVAILSRLDERRATVAKCVSDKKPIEPDLNAAKPIAPIFIPSKGRVPVGSGASSSSAAVANLLVGTVDQRVRDVCGASPCPRMVFAVHEEQEMERYVAEFAQPQASSADFGQLVHVQIPGRHRGVGFARSMIVILQETLRGLCKERSCNFDLFWQLDDDVRACMVHDPRNPGSYLPCSLMAGLAFAQDALLMELATVDQRSDFLKEEGTFGPDLIDNAFSPYGAWLDQTLELMPKGSFRRALQKHLEGARDALCQWNDCGHLVSKLMETCKEQFFNNYRDKLQPAFEQLDDELSRVKRESASGLCSLSIGPHRPRTNWRSFPDYNTYTPQATHRVSKERYGCVLTNAAVMSGFNYLSPVQGQNGGNAIFLPQAALASLHSQGPKAKNPFLQDEENFIELLAANGRGGFQLYAFSICFGDQRTGGCFFFKQNSNQRQLEQLESALRTLAVGGPAGTTVLTPEIVAGMTCKQLKFQLRALGEATSGVKGVLVNRLLAKVAAVQQDLQDQQDEKMRLDEEEQQLLLAPPDQEGDNSETDDDVKLEDSEAMQDKEKN